ncbi:hypothetical protein [Crocosphaera sp. Alani8]|uniref:hypothetical protein n=1 Tax=Crocosphaera sp. Alani8 TaxID=3038952 RepID=UPI00313D05C5
MSATTTTKPNSSKDETLTGVVERITYHAEDGSDTVAKMQVMIRSLEKIVKNEHCHLKNFQMLILINVSICLLE